MLQWINLHIVQNQKEKENPNGNGKYCRRDDDDAAGGIQMKSTYKVFKFNFPLPENWKHLMSLLKQGGRAFYFTYIYRQYTIYLHIDKPKNSLESESPPPPPPAAARIVL